jgi:hypothetical protein
MVREIKFTELEKLLLETGFVTMQTFDSQKIYQHPSSGTLYSFTWLRATSVCKNIAFSCSATNTVGKWLDGW